MKKRYYILLFMLVILLLFTSIFFIVEANLPKGWYYVSKMANTTVFVLFIIYSLLFSILLWYSCRKLKKKITNRIIKIIINILLVFSIIFIIISLAGNWFSYDTKHYIKVKQYDSHIALYVRNTFLKPSLREPCYRYEVNMFLMRELNEDELNEAIIKYGDPNDYYN